MKRGILKKAYYWAFPIALLAAPLIASAQSAGGYYNHNVPGGGGMMGRGNGWRMMGYGYGSGMHGWGIGIIGIILFVIFWALVIYLVISLIMYLIHGSGNVNNFMGKTEHKTEKRDSAIETLRMRYAKGEVSKDDYDRTIADLRSA